VFHDVSFLVSLYNAAIYLNIAATSKIVIRGDASNSPYIIFWQGDVKRGKYLPGSNVFGGASLAKLRRK
jgi:hypothetical protein